MLLARAATDDRDVAMRRAIFARRRALQQFADFSILWFLIEESVMLEEIFDLRPLRDLGGMYVLTAVPRPGMYMVCTDRLFGLAIIALLPLSKQCGRPT
jgi:hypothetical protein